MPTKRFTVDVALSKLPEPVTTDFMELASGNTSYVDLAQWLQEAICEHGLSEEIEAPKVAAIHRWWRNRRKINQQIKELNAINTEFSGLNVSDLSERLIYKLAKLSLDRIDRIHNNTELADEAFLKQLPSLIREIRGLYDILRQEKHKKLDEIYMDGAGKLYQMLRAAFADTPFESGFNEAAVASLEEMKLEAKSF